MRYKKIVFIIAFLAAFGFMFNFSTQTAKAMTIAEMQALIKQLQEQIAYLQKRLAELQGISPPWCYNFTLTLKYGDKGKEVEALQTALKKEGLLTDEEIKGEFGYFGEAVAGAVVDFQRKYRDDISRYAGYPIRPNGVVGKGTRAKLNELYGCSDLEIKKLDPDKDFHPYGFRAEYCMYGSKSINDLKKENPKLIALPAAYYVVDSYGRRYRGDVSCTGACEDLKNGQCTIIAWTIHPSERSYYDQTKRVEFVLDPDNVISETKEDNNISSFAEPISVSPRPTKVYNLKYQPVMLHGDETHLYYTIPTGGTRRVNKNTGVDEFFSDKGHHLVWVEGDYVYLGEGYELKRDGRNELYKFNKKTGKLVWHVRPTTKGPWGGATFQFGVGKSYIYARAGAYGYGAICKDKGTVLWASKDLTRYPDKVLADLKNEVVIETGYWSPNTVQRISKKDGKIIWQKKGPSEEMGEATYPVDITDDAIWVRWAKGEWPDNYFYALAKWDRNTGKLLESFPQLPYDNIWHLGPEGSLVFHLHNEKGNALVWNKNLNRLEKVNTKTWQVYWMIDWGRHPPLQYVADRPFIDGNYIYLVNKDDPLQIGQFNITR